MCYICKRIKEHNKKRKELERDLTADELINIMRRFNSGIECNHAHRLKLELKGVSYAQGTHHFHA